MSIEAELILDETREIEQDIVAYRRTIHENPEVGAVLSRTKEYVRQTLSDMGCEVTEICESGLVTTISGEDTGRCILLRADMDALNVVENTDLEFKSTNGNMHACGHDMHTAMLLGAARLLKKHEKELKGTVKLVFQPDEEGFTGAKDMLKAGVLKNPEPQAGLALHVNSGTPSGLVLCGRGTFMAGCTLFRIIIHGTGCHGAMPETGVDPINIAAHVYLALQEIISREISAKESAVVTIGKFESGQAPNIIPQEAVLEGTIRTFDRELSGKILKRIEEIACLTSQAFRGSARVEEIASAPPLKNNPDLVNKMGDYAEELFGKGMAYRLDQGGMGSEDFASYTYEIPCAYLLLGAGTKQENPLFGEPMHNAKVVFNEQILAKGAALHAYCAMKWLQES